jgi:hypothetical protein
MDVDDTRETAGDNDNIEEITAAPSEEGGGRLEQVRSALTSGINRRTFLAAAALGSAAAALAQKGSGFAGLQLGPLTAFATGDTSDLGCQAQDVRLVGNIQVVNEPCDCSPCSSTTVTAQATVSNNTGQTRYCVIAHLPPATVTQTCVSGGTTTTTTTTLTLSGTTTGLTGGDILLTTAIPQQTQITYPIVITNWLCGAGTVIFGQPTPVDNSGKTSCPQGPCAAISWLTPADKNTPCGTVTHRDIPPSKCHWQQVTITGRSQTFSCVANCTPVCGGVSTLVACASGGPTPITISLVGNGSVSSTVSPACATFQVTTTSTTTYVATVNYGGECTKTLSTVISASPLPSFTPTVTGPDCSGIATVCASVSGANNYVFSNGGTTTVTTTGTACVTQTITPSSVTQTRTVVVTASNTEGCASTATATVTVNPQVSLTLVATAPTACVALSASNVTLTATPTGGSGSYVIVIDAGAPVTTTGSATFTYTANADAVCHTVTASVTDTKGCTATATPVTISQCVNTTIGCTPIP